MPIVRASSSSCSKEREGGGRVGLQRMSRGLCGSLDGDVLHHDVDPAAGVARHAQVVVQVGDEQVRGHLKLQLRRHHAGHRAAGALERAVHGGHQPLHRAQVHRLPQDAHLAWHLQVSKQLRRRDAGVHLALVELHLQLPRGAHLKAGERGEGQHEGHRHLDLVLHRQRRAVHDLGDVAHVDERHAAERAQHRERLRVGGVHQLPAPVQQPHGLRRRRARQRVGRLQHGQELLHRPAHLHGRVQAAAHGVHRVEQRDLGGEGALLGALSRPRAAGVAAAVAVAAVAAAQHAARCGRGLDWALRLCVVNGADVELDLVARLGRPGVRLDEGGAGEALARGQAERLPGLRRQVLGGLERLDEVVQLLLQLLLPLGDGELGGWSLNSNGRADRHLD
mmetsp:Transcript_2354/g.6086  ORF Transcript_2354/g.6086 Transcript_2354/m.6086 type:complete len:393 (+) Transcript_2354:29-1207(+)